MAKKCPECGRDMHKAYGGWLCGVCAYEGGEKMPENDAEDRCLSVEEIEQLGKSVARNDQVADVLQDFAMVLVEEMAQKIDADIEWEAIVMERMNRLIRAFREGDTSPENAYKL